jgi:hypothetical protein
MALKAKKFELVMPRESGASSIRGGRDIANKVTDYWIACFRGR